MKVSDKFILREIAGDHLLIPAGDAALTVKGLIALSESAVLLYKELRENKTKENLLDSLTSEYDVSPEEAERDIDVFLAQMRQLGILVED